MHDAWIYLLVTAFGRFIYSPYATVKYRQHDSNFFGAGHSLKKRMRLRWSKLWHLSPFRRQALEFLELHGQQLDKDKFDAINKYCNYSVSTASRVAFMIKPSVVKQHWLSNIYMRLLIILGMEWLLGSDFLDDDLFSHQNSEHYGWLHRFTCTSK